MKNLVTALTLLSVFSQPLAQAQVFSAKADQNGLAVSLISQKNSDGSIDLLYCRGKVLGEQQKFDAQSFSEICAQKKVIGRYRNEAELKAQLEKAIRKDANSDHLVTGIATGAIFMTGGMIIAIGSFFGGILDFGVRFVGAIITQDSRALNPSTAEKAMSSVKQFISNNKSLIILSAVTIGFAVGRTLYVNHQKKIGLDAASVLEAAVASQNGKSVLILRSNAKVQALRELLGQANLKGELAN